jgi:hypothetical protein
MDPIRYVRYADISDGPCRSVYGLETAVEAMNCSTAPTPELNRSLGPWDTSNKFNLETTILKINKQTGYIASQQTSNIKTETIVGPASNKPHLPRWNNQSDRLVPSVQTARTARPRNASGPGAMTPGGSGVDVKHGSYDRYLARKKYKNSLNKKNECIIKKCS